MTNDLHFKCPNLNRNPLNEEQEREREQRKEQRKKANRKQILQSIVSESEDEEDEEEDPILIKWEMEWWRKEGASIII